MARSRRGKRSADLRGAGWALLRASAGLLVFLRGYRSLFSSEADGRASILHLADGLAALEFPAPDALAWLLALLAFGGGLLLVVGFFTRPLAALWALVLAASLLFSQASAVGLRASPWELAVCAALLLGGAGGFSVDEALQRRRDRLASSLFRRNVGPLR